MTRQWSESLRFRRMRPLDEIRTALAYYRRLSRLMPFLEENFRDPALRVERAARHCGISSTHLNFLLKGTTGFTSHKLLSRFRIEKARRRMAEENLSLLEIALESGFNSQLTFTRQFRSWTGQLPSEYRDQIRRNLRV